MTCPDAVGNTDPRNARIDAARPVKRRKAQGPAAAAPHVIDLTGSQSEARNLHKQVDEEAVINLVNVTSPVVHLHRPNRLAAGATSSGHDAQTHSQNMPSTSSSSHKGVASSDSNTARPRPVWMQSISSKHQIGNLNQSVGTPAVIKIKHQLAACQHYISALQFSLHAPDVPNLLFSLVPCLQVHPIGLQHQEPYMPSLHIPITAGQGPFQALSANIVLAVYISLQISQQPIPVDQ